VVASTERRPIPWLRGSAPHSIPISANRPPGYTEEGDFAPALLRLVYRFGAYEVEMERERAGPVENYVLPIAAVSRRYRC
jgi:hypothetical protein